MPDNTDPIPTPGEWAAHQSFYNLAIRERDYERVRADRFQRERDEALALVDRLMDALTTEGSPLYVTLDQVRAEAARHIKQ